MLTAVVFSVMLL